MNFQHPAYKLERSDDGSIAHRCECGIAVKRMVDLRRHWSSRRHGGRGYHCLVCRKSYSRKYMLHRHVCQAEHVTPVDAMEVDRWEYCDRSLFYWLTQ